MKNLFFALFCINILLFISCKGKEEYTVEGKIKGMTSSILYVVNTSTGEAGNHSVDTIQVTKNGHFSFKGIADELTSLVIYMNEGIVWTTVWAKNKEKIIISGDIQYPELIVAEGNPVNDLLANFKMENSEILKEKRDINDKHLSSIALTDSAGVLSSDAEYKAKISNINHQLKGKAVDFIAKNPSSVASLVLIQDYLIEIDEPQHIQQHLASVTGDAKQTRLFQKLSELNQKILHTVVNSKAPDFTVLNTHKDTFNLNSSKSKYFLLTFTASWCEPCKEENEELVNLRKKYDKTQLEMLTISLDEDSSEWKKSAKDLTIGWNQVIDTRGWNSSMVSLYNITAVPSNILMDANKIILGRDLSSDSIVSTLTRKSQ